jgi:ribosomal protein L40E
MRGDAVICHHCRDESPPDARFCIGCGAALAATEETGRLAETECPDCYALNSDDAWNCRNCGRRLASDLVSAYQPVFASDNGRENRAAATDDSWLGDLLIVAIELIGWLVVS